MTDHGHCEECSKLLVHVVGERAGGVVCLDCDHEFVSAIGEHLSIAGVPLATARAQKP